MTVKELIEALQEIDNKDLEVFIYSDDNDIQKIDFIDILDDRIDLTIVE